MREIKFRIKSRSGQWYFFGVYAGKPDVPTIPETLGEFTGLKDRNSKEIWDGDILLMAHHERAEVKWQTSRGRWVAVTADNRALFPFKSGWDLSEVIGNIHDNSKPPFFDMDGEKR